MTYYFEDLAPGTTFELGSATVTEADIIRFGKEFDPQSFHTDPEAAVDSPFHGLVASGLHTFCIFHRMMMIELMMKVASLGGAGVDEMRWRVPVRPGDDLRARATILADSRISTTKPDRGVLFVRGELENQAQELVWEAKLSAVVLLKTPVEL